MKSSNIHTHRAPGQDLDGLRTAMKKEKEALVSMFLANASLTELSSKYKVINDVSLNINGHNVLHKPHVPQSIK